MTDSNTDTTSDARIGRTYPLDLERPGAGYFQVEPRGSGSKEQFGWAWYEAGEPADRSTETFDYPSQALLAAADNAEDSIAEYDDGRKLARRMRASARALAKKELAMAAKGVSVAPSRTTSTGTTVTLEGSPDGPVIVLSNDRAPSDLRRTRAGRVIDGGFQPAPFAAYAMSAEVLRIIAGILEEQPS